MIKKTKLAVDMTTEGALVCQRCHNAQPEGVNLTFVKNGDNARRGRNCCPRCLYYYRVKKAGLDNENDGVHFIFAHLRKFLQVGCPQKHLAVRPILSPAMFWHC